MADEIKNGATAETPKKVRRGVSNATQAVTQMKFSENDAAPNHFFVGHLEEARVDYSVASESTSFVGLNMPRLTLHFASNHSDKNITRHVYHTLFPIESNVETIPGGSNSWRVNNIFAWIKHILDVYYLRGRQFTEKEEDALALDFEDFDENGQYVHVDPQTVLNAYATLFNNAVAMLEGKFDELKEGETPKCYYKDANGNPIAVWMKLLRHTRDAKKVWRNVTPNGDLGFTTFLGTGAIEIMKTNTPPQRLSFDPSKESITPKETNNQPTFGGQGMPMMGSVVAPNMGGAMNTNNAAFAEAMGDMPF